MSAAGSWRAWAAAAAIFVLGISLGVTGTAFYGLRALRTAVRAAGEPGPGPIDRAAARIADELVDSLQLRPADAERVRAELARTAANIRSIRVQTNRQLIMELRQSSRRIAAELPPEQRAQFYARLEGRLRRLGFEGGGRLRPENPEESPPPPGSNGGPPRPPRREP